MGDAAMFFKAWIRHPACIGAVAPSSDALAREMTRDLRPQTGEAILEFGPGTGPFTARILPQLDDPGRYLGIEREPRFITLLQQRFPQMRFALGSAEQAPQLLREAGLERIRAVICGLPFASLPSRVQDGVIDALVQVLAPGSEFRTFQYVHAYGLPTAIRYRRRMAAAFGRHRRSGAVLRNMPPAYVLTWQR